MNRKRILGGLLGGLLTGTLFSLGRAAAGGGLSTATGLGIPSDRGTYRFRLQAWDGACGLFFWNDKTDRLTAGLYPDGKLCWLGLGHPENGHIPRLLCRLEGANENPMLFLKNRRDVHRIDMGVDINAPDEDPYLVYWDARGQKHEVFGTFPYLK